MNKSIINGKSVTVSCMAFGNTKILKKIDEMQSAGKPVDCIECGACSSCCQGRIDVKRFIRELAMMQSCGRLIPSAYGRKKELVG